MHIFLQTCIICIVWTAYTIDTIRPVALEKPYCCYQMKRITLEVSEELYQDIKKFAFVEDRSISSVTREALEMFCIDRQIRDIKIMDTRNQLEQ